MSVILSWVNSGYNSCSFDKKLCVSYAQRSLSLISTNIFKDMIWPQEVTQSYTEFLISVLQNYQLSFDHSGI